MKYTIEKWHNRTIFRYKECLKTFEEFSEIIDKNIIPDSKSKTQITSWTCSFCFIKSGIEVYFENFYDDDSPSYSFELFPLGNCDESGIEKLKLMMDSLESFV